ncbi:MAG: VOC family protein [Actinomycetota bacterium]
MTTLNPYLNFAGNAEEAFSYYKGVFGSEFNSFVRFKDMPMEDFPVPEAEQDKLMHVGLPVGPDSVLMASDVPESFGQVVPGNNFYVSVGTDSKEEADRIFNALAEGGTVEMALADQVWGDYFGSLADKFQINWMISFTQPSP